MRFFNIADDIEQILLNYAISVPDLFLQVEVRDNLELVSLNFVESDEDAVGVYEIVYAIDEEEELVLGEITLYDDFSASLDIFEDEGVVL